MTFVFEQLDARRKAAAQEHAASIAVRKEEADEREAQKLFEQQFQKLHSAYRRVNNQYQIPKELGDRITGGIQDMLNVPLAERDIAIREMVEEINIFHKKEIEKRIDTLFAVMRVKDEEIPKEYRRMVGRSYKEIQRFFDAEEFQKAEMYISEMERLITGQIAEASLADVETHKKTAEVSDDHKYKTRSTEYILKIAKQQGLMLTSAEYIGYVIHNNEIRDFIPGEYFSIYALQLEGGDRQYFFKRTARSPLEDTQAPKPAVLSAEQFELRGMEGGRLEQQHYRVIPQDKREGEYVRRVGELVPIEQVTEKNGQTHWEIQKNTGDSKLCELRNTLLDAGWRAADAAAVSAWIGKEVHVHGLVQQWVDAEQKKQLVADTNKILDVLLVRDPQSGQETYAYAIRRKGEQQKSIPEDLNVLDISSHVYDYPDGKDQAPVLGLYEEEDTTVEIVMPEDAPSDLPAEPSPASVTPPAPKKSWWQMPSARVAAVTALLATGLGAVRSLFSPEKRAKPPVTKEIVVLPDTKDSPEAEPPPTVGDHTNQEVLEKQYQPSLAAIERIEAQRTDQKEIPGGQEVPQTVTDTKKEKEQIKKFQLEVPQGGSVLGTLGKGLLSMGIDGRDVHYMTHDWYAGHKQEADQLLVHPQDVLHVDIRVGDDGKNTISDVQVETKSKLEKLQDQATKMAAETRAVTPMTVVDKTFTVTHIDKTSGESQSYDFTPHDVVQYKGKSYVVLQQSADKGGGVILKHLDSRRQFATTQLHEIMPDVLHKGESFYAGYSIRPDSRDENKLQITLRGGKGIEATTRAALQAYYGVEEDAARLATRIAVAKANTRGVPGTGVSKYHTLPDLVHKGDGFTVTIGGTKEKPTVEIVQIQQQDIP